MAMDFPSVKAAYDACSMSDEQLEFYRSRLSEARETLYILGERGAVVRDLESRVRECDDIQLRRRVK